jgi:hypothetical protein
VVSKSIILAAVVAVLASANLALAQAPTTRRSRPMVERRGDATMPRLGREHLGTYDPAATGGQLSDAEREEVMRFMEKYSPRRAQRLKDVPEKRQEPILRHIDAQYRALQRAKDEDPQIYELRLKRLPIEDAMFDLGWQLKHDDDNTTRVTNEELRSRLRDQVRQFVDNCLEERRLRADRQAQRIRQEQQKLESEQKQLGELIANKESLIEKGVSAIEEERAGALKDLVAPPRKLPRTPSATEPTATAGSPEAAAAVH